MNQLRQIRERKGLNQRQLAEKAHVCQGLISDFERETRKPWASVRSKIARALGVSENEIFGE